MARNTDRPVVQRQAPVQLQTPGRPVTSSGLPPVADPSRGLLEGLAVLNPVLRGFAQQQMDYAGAAAEVAGQRAGTEADLSKVDPNTLDQQAAPESVPAAFSDRYVAGLRSAVGERIAIKAKQDMWGSYLAQRHDENFDAESWMTQWKNEQFAGISDPVVRDSIARHHNEAVTAIRDDQIKLADARRRDLALGSAGMIIQNAVSPTMSAADLHSAYVNEVQPKVLGLAQFTRKEIAQMFLGQVHAASIKAGGAPELFDALTSFTDGDGMTVAARNPEIAPQIEQWRQQAIQHRDERLKLASEDDQARDGLDIAGTLRSNPAVLTDEVLISRMGRYGSSIHNHQDVLRIAAARDKAIGDQVAVAQATALARAGLGSFIQDESIKKLVISNETMPARNALLAGISSAASALNAPNLTAQQRADAVTGLSQQAAVVADKLVAAHSMIGAGEADAGLKGMFTALTQAVPAKDGNPPPNFQMLSEVYRSLPDGLKQLYASDGDTRRLLETYSRARNNEATPEAAYAAAYRAVSPEGKAYREARLKDADVQDKIKQLSSRGPEGAMRWLGWVPFTNLQPKNEGVVAAGMQQEAMQAIQDNPDISNDELKAHLTGWVEKNYVLNRSSGIATRLPPSMNGPETRKALTDYLDTLDTNLRIKDRPGGTWAHAMVPDNLEQGTYKVFETEDGVLKGLVGSVSLKAIQQAYAAKAALNPQDKQQLGAVQEKLNNGTFTPADAETYAQAIGKARSLGVLPKGFDDQLLKARQGALQQRMNDTPQLSVGAPDNANILDQRPGRPNPQTTADAAQRFLSIPGYKGMALALVTMGEGMSLTRYADPGKGAGDNIAMGYNLKANLQTAPEDLRRAGVPPERISDVLSGKARLTPEQAMALTQVALPRYEAKAASAVNSVQPGLWDRMLGPQKAVLIDLAWQTGNPQQFQRAIDALVKGEPQRFADETRVFYTNQAGQRVEDKRRNNLRAHMLAGSFERAVLGAVRAVPEHALTAQLP